MTVAATIVTIVMAVVILLWVGYLVYPALRAHFSPKYALKRKLKDEARLDRSLAKFRNARDRKEDRLQTWVSDHPDDPTAQAYQTYKAARITEFGLSTAGDQPTDLGAELRRRQQAADESERELEAYRHAKERKDQELLEWAIAHPETPEGRRCLDEKLDELTTAIDHLHIFISSKQSYIRMLDEAEQIATQMAIDSMETQKRTMVKLMQRISTALDSVVPTS